MNNLRLQDPDNLVSPAELEILNDKLSTVLGRMARSSAKGGNPFFFSLAATKYHILKGSLPSVKDWRTAATDGNVYYWHPEFLGNLEVSQIRAVQIHESMHVICRHVDRFEGKNVHLWRLATDFYVNAAIEKEYKDSGKLTAQTKDDKHPIWHGYLGKPATLEEVKQKIKEYHENPDKVVNNKNKDERRCCADPSLVGRSADDIYRELLEQTKKYPPPEGEGEGLARLGDCFGSDEHIPLKSSKKEILKQLLQAAETARRMRGTIPNEIMEELKHLEEPQLTWQDICRQSLQRLKERNGRLNDWTRFRRRALSLGLYIPSKVEFNGRILAMVDTSGSMSNDDLIYAISQLKVIDGHTTAVVVPNDASPKWEHAIEVKRANDLTKFKAAGRGGTDFVEFFKDYRTKLSKFGKFDLIVVLTDGYFGSIPLEYKPPCDTVWVITNNQKPQIPFGYLAPLRNQRPGDE